jgi:hypothetical protein
MVAIDYEDLVFGDFLVFNPGKTQSILISRRVGVVKAWKKKMVWFSDVD